MDELIPIITNGDIKAVDGRTLHEFLEVGRDFSNWIKDRIEKYGFVENEDYQKCSPNLATDSNVAHNRIEYIISLDMAKELAMVENNNKGKQARRYFIEVEKKAVALQSALAPMTHEEMMLQVMTTLTAQVAEQKAIAQEAIRTKAEIGSRREATAMNLASQKSKEVKRLEIQLDSSKDYATVRKVQIVCGIEANWRELKKESISLGLDIHTVPDELYGSVKSYHKEVWQNCYGIDITSY